MGGGGEIAVGVSGSRGFGKKWYGRYMGAESAKKRGMRKIGERAAAAASARLVGSGILHKFQGRGLCKSLIFIFGDLHKPEVLF